MLVARTRFVGLRHHTSLKSDGLLERSLVKGLGQCCNRCLTLRAQSKWASFLRVLGLRDPDAHWPDGTTTPGKVRCREDDT